MNFFHPSLFYPKSIAQTHVVVEGTLAGQNEPSRIGTVEKTPQGAFVRILECAPARRSRQIAGFSAHNTDQALAMVHGHQAMAGLQLRTVY